MDLSSLKLYYPDGGPMSVSLSQEAWKSVLKRDIAWQARSEAAKLCETQGASPALPGP